MIRFILQTPGTHPLSHADPAPAHPGLIPWLRLVEQLAAGIRLGHRLILASAPTGSGKTSLLSLNLGMLKHTFSRSRIRSILTLPAGDRATLYGLLSQLGSLNLKLIAVRQIEDPSEGDHHA